MEDKEQIDEINEDRDNYERAEGRSFCASMKELGKYSFWSVMGQILVPMFSVTNTAIVGKMFGEEYLAGYGLG